MIARNGEMAGRNAGSECTRLQNSRHTLSFSSNDPYRFPWTSCAIEQSVMAIAVRPVILSQNVNSYKSNSFSSDDHSAIGCVIRRCLSPFFGLEFSVAAKLPF
jgi:hypothetical protein